MRFLSAIFLCFLGAAGLKAQPGSFQFDVKIIRTSICDYLSSTAENAFNYAPAGIMSEKGCFNEKMDTKVMDRLADPLDEHVFYSSLGEQFYRNFYTFSLANQQAFKHSADHVQDRMFNQHVLYPCSSCNINHLLDVSNHILHLYMSTDECNPLVMKIRDRVIRMYDNVGHGNNSSETCNETGWITHRVHDAAREGLEQLKEINLGNRASSAGKLSMVMSHFYKNLIALPVQDYDTYLSPEWQVGYFTIMYSTYLELKHMDFSPSSTAYLDYAAFNY